MGFQDFEVISITKTESLSTLRDIQSPLLLPGTTYKIYGLIILLLILFALMVRIIMKRKALAFFFKNEVLLWKYKKNKKATIRQLLKLEQVKTMADSQIAREIQKITRSYLEFRFDYPFTKLVSSEIMEGFNKATCNLMSDKKIFAAEEIVRIFVRTDYVRYGENVSFKREEKHQLISALINSIEVLEAVDVPEEEAKTVKVAGEGENA